MTDLAEAIEAGANALAVEFPAKSALGLLTYGDAADIVVPAAYAVIEPMVRAKVAEQIARAVEVARGDRCPECGGKAASHTVNGTQVIRRGGCGHIWRHTDRPWLDYDPAAIARQHAATPTDSAEVTA